MTPTEARDRVTKIAKRDARAAHGAAREIQDPWFRAQALGWVARYAADAVVESVAEEALGAARACTEAFRTCGSAAWPVRALVERGENEAAHRALSALRPRFADVEPASSRAEAVFLLYQAAFTLGSGVREPLLEVLAAAQAADDHWRPARALIDALHMLAAAEPARATELASAISDDRIRRKALVAIEKAELLEPREFFW